MDKETILKMKEEISKIFDSNLDIKELNDLKVEYLGKSGRITELSKGMKDVPNEEKKEYGMLLNELREIFNSHYESYKEK